MPLEEQFYEVPRARYLRDFPWLRVFRSFRMALDVRKLLLALVGLLVFFFGRSLLLSLPFAPPAQIAAMQSSPPWRQTFVSPLSDPLIARGLGSSTNPALPTPIRPVSLLSPWRDLVNPATTIISPLKTWAETGWAWTELLWALIVWGFFGGAIARIAALEIAGAGSPNLRAAIRHSARYLTSSLGGPLLPVIGIGLFWGIAATLGLFGRIGGVGPLMVGAFWFIALICGAILALIAIGVSAGWPLMIATISTEGSDAFDGLSRSYSYIFGRAWYAIFILALTLIYGSIVTMFLFGAASLAGELANWAVASGMGAEGLGAIQGTTIADWSNITGAAGKLTAFWNAAAVTLLTAFIYSFFWTAVTIAYFLLRHAEDATPFSSAFVPSPAGPEGPALSGMAAAEYREQQASAGTPPAADSAASDVPPAAH